MADSPSCQTAIAAAVRRLDRVPNTVVEFSTIDRHGYQSHPEGRSQLVKFGVSGSGAKDILNSPVFLTEISTAIVGDCVAVGVVGFGAFQANWGRFFGLMPTGNVREFECMAAFDPESNPTAEMFWGSVWCPQAAR